jgi:DNA invertase Pin-like site-specific DNA recombinase
MASVGYIRVSTVDQNTDRQLDGMSFDKVFEDKCGGGDTKRPALTALLDYVREGDTVHVHSIDRLARNSADLLNLVESLKARGVTVTFEKEGLTFDARKSDPFKELMFHMLGAFAQFERSIIGERQREGIEKAKSKGVYKGGKKVLDRAKVLSMLEEGMGPSVIAKDLGIGRMSVYRIKKEAMDA